MNLFLASDPRPVHFVGIAGAGMSALAMLALRRGVAVTGSDRSPEGAPDLPGLGARVWKDPAPARVDGARAVVYSAAITADHPELERARALGLELVPRKEALARLVEGRTVVAVAGTHGKTTTTAMTGVALHAAGREPTVLAGGRVAGWGGNTLVGGDTLYVVEADEYDQAFLALHPTVAVITNVEPEHLECYGGSAEAMEEAFARFASRAETVVVSADDAGAGRVAERAGGRPLRFGTAAGADIRLLEAAPIADGGTATVLLPGEVRLDLRLRLPGMHNLRNAAAALAVVHALGAVPAAAAAALAIFEGVGRRFDRLGEVAGVAVVDDYAHHPTEIAVTLSAAGQAFPGRRLVAVFQPHLYSRTAALGDRMGEALAAADRAYVTEVYAAREAPIPGVSGAQVAEAATRRGAQAVFAPEREELLRRLEAELLPGDVVLTLGAGDVTTLGPALLDRLAGRRGA